MATTRNLTIAALRGNFYLSFRDVANQSLDFSSICSGLITVDRSRTGRTYKVSTSVDHIRVFAKIVGPDDLPNLFLWSRADNYGWWHMDGYQQTDYAAGGDPGLTADQFEAWVNGRAVPGRPVDTLPPEVPVGADVNKW